MKPFLVWWEDLFQKLKIRKKGENKMNIKRLKIAFTNIYLIETKKGLLMIDTSYPNTYETFLKKLDKEGISLEDIKYLILTHHHDDHAGFLANMLKKHELRVFLHQKSIPLPGSSCIA